MQRDQADVMYIMTTIQNMVNPFNPLLDGESLDQVSFGQQASDEIAKDILWAKQRGVKALTDFCEKRIVKAETSFHDPIKKMKMKTFKDTGQSTVSKIRGK